MNKDNKNIEEKDKKLLKSKYFWIIVILSVIAVVLIIFPLISANCFSPIVPNFNAENIDWLAYYGSLLGSFIGFGGVVATLIHTSNQAKKVEEDKQKEERRLLEEKAKQDELSKQEQLRVEKNAEEERRLSVKPFIKIDVIYEHSSTTMYGDIQEITLNFVVSNIGAGPAINLKVSFPSYEILLTKTNKIVLNKNLENGKEENIKKTFKNFSLYNLISISYSDIYEYSYSQKRDFICKKINDNHNGQKYFIEMGEISHPELIPKEKEEK